MPVLSAHGDHAVEESGSRQGVVEPVDVLARAEADSPVHTGRTLQFDEEAFVRFVHLVRGDGDARQRHAQNETAAFGFEIAVLPRHLLG